MPKFEVIVIMHRFTLTLHSFNYYYITEGN